MPKSDTYFRDGNEAAVTHGIHSLERTGKVPDRLSTAALEKREAEIVANLADLSGIEREMENAARIGLLCLELGANWLDRELAKGHGFADIALMSKLRAYISGTMRDLRELAAIKEKLGKDGGAIDAALQAAEELQRVAS